LARRFGHYFLAAFPVIAVLSRSGLWHAPSYIDKLYVNRQASPMTWSFDGAEGEVYLHHTLGEFYKALIPRPMVLLCRQQGKFYMGNCTA